MKREPWQEESDCSLMLFGISMGYLLSAFHPFDSVVMWVIIGAFVFKFANAVRLRMKADE